MTFYMIRDKHTGQYFKRRGGWLKGPKGASVWTTEDGPNAAKGAITRDNNAGYKPRDAVVVPITVEETQPAFQDLP